MPAQAAVNTAFAGFLRAAAIRPGTQPGSFGMIGLNEDGAWGGRAGGVRQRADDLRGDCPLRSVCWQWTTGQALFASTLAERLRGHELKDRARR